MELLKKLCGFNACSGNEETLAKFIKEEISVFAESVYTDALGNLFAVKHGSGKKLMLVTHMDSRGFFTTVKDMVSTVGDIDLTTVNNSIVQYENGDLAVFSAEKTDKITDFTLKPIIENDTDYTGKTSVFKPCFNTNGGFVISPALSARIGCYVLIRLIKEIKSDCEITFVFTVKKNAGMKGARVAAYDIAPEKAIVVDCFDADCKPVVMVKDKSYIADVCLKDALANCGFTPIVSKDGRNEASAIQTTAGGVPCAAVGTGVKFIGKPNEIASAASIDGLFENLKRYIDEEL